MVVQFDFRGTHTGPLQGPNGEIPPTGRAVDVPVCDVFQLRNGKAVGVHSYFDAATLMTQLGLLPALAAIQ